MTWSGPEVLLVREAGASGVRLRDQGALERVRRGAYVTRAASAGPARDRRRLALARIRAAGAQLHLAHWFSHESAALLWGCDVVGLSGLVHVVQETRPHARGGDPLVRHYGRLPAAHRAEVDGFPVTSLARTVVDCAATLPADRALVVADSALRRGLDPAGVAGVVRSRAGTRGIARAREVLGAADGRAESPGETLVRWAVVSGGLPPPEPQVEVRTRRGVFRLDLGWRAPQVGLEFDGFVKYSGAFGSTAAEAVFAEKQRQDALEEEGWRILRVTWGDLRDTERLVTRVRRALTGRGR